MDMRYKITQRSHASHGAVVLACCVAALGMAPAGATALEGTAEAQPSEAPVDTSAAAQQDGVGVNEIVVTARRVAENLQDVPQQVTAVSGQELSKLSITQFENVDTLVPALTLGRDAFGFASPSIRGVPFDAIASSAPTVDIYINEVPLDSTRAFAAFFDIANIQVLEGPQGTARGRTAPSGAVLLTTRRPSLDQLGGYASGLVAELGEYNVQGAVNVPLVSGKLAVRVAGLYSRTPGNFVRSLNSDLESNRRDVGARVTALFQPSDDFDLQITYQHHDQENTIFPAVSGNGSPGATFTVGNTVFPNPFAPPGYNGPPISPNDRLAVADVPSRLGFTYNLIMAQANANLLGHRLSYIGSYNRNKGTRNTADDPANLFPGASVTDGLEPNTLITQELRFASEQGGFLDYTLGYFFSREKSSAVVNQFAGYLTGTFGPTPPFNPAAFDSRYVLPLVIDAPIKRVEHSVFASVTLRPGPATEITLGGRKLFLNSDSRILASLPGGRVVATPDFGLPCAFIPSPVPLVSSLYAGYCDVIIPPGVAADFPSKINEKPFVYSASVSHRFTDDIMVYGTIASSFRTPFPTVSLRNGDNDPLLNELSFPDPEKSKSFELGLKTSWLDDRLRVNVAAFYQKFDGLLFSTLAVPYLSVAGPIREVSATSFNVNGDATAKGFNFDAAFQPTRHFFIGGSVSYAKAKLNNQLVPCRDVNFDGIPDATGAPTVADFEEQGVYVAQCVSNEVISREPLWKATLQSEFSRPINSRMDAYVRGLMTYYSSNSHANTNYTVDSYVMMTLYAGVRSSNGAWDFGVFLRNATDTKVELLRGDDDLNFGGGLPFGLAGYRSSSLTAPQQVGVSLRYAFGSR